MADDKTNQNIGELADDNLRHLTTLEDLLNDLERGREPTEHQLRKAREALEQAQDNSNETLRRFEKQVGPI